MVPDSFLVLKHTKKLLEPFLPTTRPMDSMKVDMDGPYEEEAGMAALSRWSFFHCFNFPKTAEQQYLNAVHFKNLSQVQISEWKEKYLWLLKAITYESNGKQLMLKNPPNTARIKTILEIFPNAYFIHIYRNPYKVYYSTKQMRTRVLNYFTLQHPNYEEIENLVIENYKLLMNSYFEQKDLIPKDHLIEIKFEEFVKDPIKTMNHIYKTFNIEGIEKAEPYMREYLDSKKNYKKNVYKMDKKTIDLITKNWLFTIKRWKYKTPE
jgi:hypothetical protein